MTRKATRRKHWGLIDPIRHAILGAGITGQVELDKLRLRELAAIDNFANGAAGLSDWRDVADLSNIAETMGLDGIGPEVLPVCAGVQELLQEAAMRFEAMGGLMGVTEPGLQLLRDLYEFHDLQRTSVSRADYERAIKKTAARASCAQNSERDVVML